jgi:uncharacterized protein YndB with AHSA1/START domain
MTAPQREFTIVRAFDAPHEQDGSRCPTVARFREIVEPERLVFTWATRTTKAHSSR